MREALRRFITDRNGRVAVAQVPNVPLAAWAVLALAARLADARWASFLDFLSGATLVTWAWLEITQGDSLFRRALGGIVLVALLASRWPG